ncbi:MAG TPA: hypothetical protein DCL77_02335 [Prolixibacteraceae bacterium]|jgi:hypothetical protein|nr:hypothetical protein [Prolixibacteraceae bacterium]
MRKIQLLTLLIVSMLWACSTGQKSLERGNYYDAIMKAVNRLSSDPDNRKASQVVREGYPMAITYYQEEIDQILTSNDQFRWKRTLEIMQTVNGMSDGIRRIPAARSLVTTFKTYTSELADVQNKAAQEFYDAGMDALSQKTREAAKQAYFDFLNADAMVRNYKDTRQKMLESKDIATLKVVVEQIPVNGKYEYSAQFFYDNVFQMLNGKFQEKDFVHFFSPTEAERMKLRIPDMVLKMGFYDFFIDRPQHSEEQQELSKQIEEKYTVKISKDSTVTRTRLLPKKGKIKILTDQVASGGLLELKAVDFQSQKIVFTDKLPGEFTWQNKYGIFVGDNEVLDKDQNAILNNKMVMPPASQDMFVLFTKPIFNQLTEKLTNYFKQFN